MSEDRSWLPAENFLWDPFGAILVDAWNPNLGPYTRTILGSVDPANVRAVFESMDSFQQYQSSCSAGPLTTTVKEVATEDDKTTIVSLLGNSDDAVDCAFITGEALELLPGIGELLWPLAVVSVLRGALDQTDYVQHVQKTRASIAELMAIGGSLKYSEYPYQPSGDGGSWMLHRAVVYEVKVGEELRLTPVCVQALQVVCKDS